MERRRGVEESLRAALLATGLAAAGVGACSRPPTWVASPGREAAEATEAPVLCEEQRLEFRPAGPALLGSRPEVLRRWAARAFPNHFPVGRRGRFGLVPVEGRGAALLAATRSGRVVFVSIQSHGGSAASATPLAARAVRAFLLRATSCASYRLCEARVDLDEARYRGHTTCPGVAVPVQVVTPRNGRLVVAVSTWLPLFEREAESATGRQVSRP